MNPFLEGTRPNFWLSCLLFDEERAYAEKSREELLYEGTVSPLVLRLMKALADENIESRPIWKPMHMQPYYKNCDYVTAGGRSVDEDIFLRGLCLPSDIKMTEEEQDKIIEIIGGLL